jgi:NodT family efflux transporter outer membrane factor (OMF) lipoprotein
MTMAKQTRPCRERSELGNMMLSAGTVLIALLASAAMLVGCASPAGIAPTQKMMAASDAGAVEAAATAWPQTDWWKSWGDARLDQLVEQAIGTQPNLQTVQARLKQAQAAVDVAGANRLPQVNGQASATYQRLTENGLYPPPFAGSKLWADDAQIGASWELDLFGRQRAALDSAIGQLRAAEAESQAARLLLSGNVVAGYVTLARLVETRGLLQDGLRQREQVLSIVRQRTGAGLDTNVDLRQAEGSVAQIQVELEGIDESIGRSRHAIAELAGLGPDALNDLAPKLAEVKGAPLPQGLPADLIGRRADLVAQRWRVESAMKDVKVARTQFYPNLNLTAFVGLSSFGFDRFLKAGSETYGAGPALHLPIFEGGRLRANLAAKSADVDIAVDAYNTALLRALREVADEVTSLQSLERQQRAQADALKSAESAFDLALQRYRSGLGNFLVVLTADANVIGQRRATAELKARQLSAEASLTRALGGGYQAEAQSLPPLASLGAH